MNSFESNPHTDFIKAKYTGRILHAHKIVNTSDTPITNISGGEKFDQWNDQHIAIFCETGGFTVYTKAGINKRRVETISEADRGILFDNYGFGWTPKQWPPERLYLYWDVGSVYYCAAPIEVTDMIKPINFDLFYSWQKISSEEGASYELRSKQEAFLAMGSGAINGESAEGPCVIPSGSTFEAEGSHHIAILTDKRA